MRVPELIFFFLHEISLIAKIFLDVPPLLSVKRLINFTMRDYSSCRSVPIFMFTSCDHNLLHLLGHPTHQPQPSFLFLPRSILSHHFHCVMKSYICINPNCPSSFKSRWKMSLNRHYLRSPKDIPPRLWQLWKRLGAFHRGLCCHC